MNIEEIIQSNFSNSTKSRMFRDYLERDNGNLDLLHYCGYYTALSIIELLDKYGAVTVDEKMAEDIHPYRHHYFTAWLVEDLIIQWDDTNLDCFKEKYHKPQSCVDKRFFRWWMYPKDLVKNQGHPHPLPFEYWSGLNPRPISSLLAN